MEKEMNKWIKLVDQKPQDRQRVLVFNETCREATIQVYNDYDQCWDTEDGDDYEFDLSNGIYWSPIPDNPYIQSAEMHNA